MTNGSAPDYAPKQPAGLRVLVVGSGGREHAIAWKLRQSPLLGSLTVAPGNPGIEPLARLVPIGADDVDGLVAHARNEHYDLVVVGPEDPLAGGLVDRLMAAGIRTFGPARAAACIESSKAFAKAICKQCAIPTAESYITASYQEALAVVREHALPVVIKADGLCKGKGVVIARTEAEANAALRAMLVDRAFVEAGNQVLLEEFLEGPELSVLAFSDGTRSIAMLPARDHKPVYDGNRGPNTGGMGAIAPVDDPHGNFADLIQGQILQPAIDAMRAMGTPFRGVLYAGCIVTSQGPKLLEFNCRFGDPETQVLLPLLENDLLDIFLRCANGELGDITLRWHDQACVGVVLASGGYPGHYDVGVPINGLDDVARDDGALIFHAGTARSGGEVVTAGGRVLCVCGLGSHQQDAAARAYDALRHIHFAGAHFRRDIALLPNSMERT